MQKVHLSVLPTISGFADVLETDGHYVIARLNLRWLSNFMSWHMHLDLPLPFRSADIIFEFDQSAVPLRYRFSTKRLTAASNKAQTFELSAKIFTFILGNCS